MILSRTIARCAPVFLISAIATTLYALPLPPENASMDEAVRYCSSIHTTDLFCEAISGTQIALSDEQLHEYCETRADSDILCRYLKNHPESPARDCYPRECDPLTVMGNVACVSTKCNYCDVGSWSCVR